MKTHSSLPLFMSFLFAAGALAQGDSNGTYPTTFKANGFNSTEAVAELGTTPVAPLGEIQANDPWSTPLVDGCPKLCSVTGPEPGNWTHTHDHRELFKCEEPLLFTLNVDNTPDSSTTINACALSAGKAEAKRSYIDGIVYKRQDNSTLRGNSTSPSNSTTPSTGPITPGGSCGAYEVTADGVFSAGPAGVLKSGADAAAAAESLAAYLKDGAGCGTTIVFVKHSAAVVGVYSGPDVPSASSGKVLSANKDRLSQGTQLFQICNTNSRDAATLGVFAIDNVKDLVNMQSSLKTWAEGGCVAVSGNEEKIQWTVLSAEPEPSTAEKLKRKVAGTLENFKPRFSIDKLEKRADCRAIQVASGDGCAALAAKCGIRGADFTKYNPDSNLCSTLKEKQWVCCSAGDLPDMTPKPQADGTCAIYTIAPNDGCAAIEASFGLTNGTIEELNKQTWGWAGCSRIQPDQVICISKGNVPMPAQISGVACGPQKLGTQRPSDNYTGFDLAELNQCPLNACCSGWGYCGTTEEFCTETKSETGAPGSFKKGTNGCISNCGMEIVNNKVAPESFSKLGYFQAYNGARDCLNMDVSEVEGSDEGLTHVHFAFAGLNADFTVKISDQVQDQFDKFVSSGYKFKKIISFGGWAESTGGDTFQRYKDAVKGNNRQKFASNVKAFLDEHNLDGVDFDWEYPGARDIPGVPTDGDVEAQDYLRFLIIMRGLLGTGDGHKTLSIALPASFWYLKPFPVDKMAVLLDYFVYMTYDLHGQWDYGSKFANPGCDSGNCLRSHINMTETMNALSMITKAGVPANKIFVGVSSYGRSFRMADSSCTGENCKFTGAFSVSDAEPGQCTGTGGYISNAELEEIANYAEYGIGGFQVKKWYDEKTDSDMMTYGTQGNGMTDWVAYMTDTTKNRRRDKYKGLNFGGTTDWAIDLGNWHEGKNKATNQTGFDATPLDLVCNSDDWPKTLDDLEKNINKVPLHCRGMALTRVLVAGFEAAISEYNVVQKDYDDKFGWYADWVKDAINERLDAYMLPIAGPGNKYIDCSWETRKVKGSGPCTQARFPVEDQANPGPRVVNYHLPIRDEAGFFKELFEKTGIKKEWVQFKDDVQTQPCPCPVIPCPNQPICEQNYFMRKNMPRRINDKSKIDVENPKKIINEAIPNMAELSSIALATYYELRMGTMDASDVDIALSLAMPLFMLQDASDSIKEIKDIGEEQKKQKTRDLVLMILSIVFSVIPFGGQALQALGGATKIAQAALIIGEAGNAALTIVEIVKDPTSAPFAILGMLLGAGGIRAKGPKKAFKDAADARRALDKGEGLKMFSDAFKKKDSQVQNIIKACVF